MTNQEFKPGITPKSLVKEELSGRQYLQATGEDLRMQATETDTTRRSELAALILRLRKLISTPEQRLSAAQEAAQTLVPKLATETAEAYQARLKPVVSQLLDVSRAARRDNRDENDGLVADFNDLNYLRESDPTLATIDRLNLNKKQPASPNNPENWEADWQTELARLRRNQLGKHQGDILRNRATRLRALAKDGQSEKRLAMADKAEAMALEMDDKEIARTFVADIFKMPASTPIEQDLFYGKTLADVAQDPARLEPRIAAIFKEITAKKSNPGLAILMMYIHGMNVGPALAQLPAEARQAALDKEMAHKLSERSQSRLGLSGPTSAPDTKPSEDTLYSRLVDELKASLAEPALAKPEQPEINRYPNYDQIAARLIASIQSKTNPDQAQDLLVLLDISGIEFNPPIEMPEVPWDQISDATINQALSLAHAQDAITKYQQHYEKKVGEKFDDTDVTAEILAELITTLTAEKTKRQKTAEIKRQDELVKKLWSELHSLANQVNVKFNALADAMNALFQRDQVGLTSGENFRFTPQLLANLVDQPIPRQRDAAQFRAEPGYQRILDWQKAATQKVENLKKQLPSREPLRVSTDVTNTIEYEVRHPNFSSGEKKLKTTLDLITSAITSLTDRNQADTQAIQTVKNQLDSEAIQRIKTLVAELEAAFKKLQDFQHSRNQNIDTRRNLYQEYQAQAQNKRQPVGTLMDLPKSISLYDLGFDASIWSEQHQALESQLTSIQARLTTEKTAIEQAKLQTKQDILYAFVTQNPDEIQKLKADPQVAEAQRLLDQSRPIQRQLSADLDLSGSITNQIGSALAEKLATSEYLGLQLTDTQKTILAETVQRQITEGQQFMQRGRQEFQGNPITIDTQKNYRLQLSIWPNRPYGYFLAINMELPDKQTTPSLLTVNTNTFDPDRVKLQIPANSLPNADAKTLENAKTTAREKRIEELSLGY